MGEVSFGPDIGPEKARRTAGDLALTHVASFPSVAEASRGKKRVVLIHEIQYFTKRNSRLIIAITRSTTRAPADADGRGMPHPPVAGNQNPMRASGQLHRRWRAFEEDAAKALRKPASVGVFLRRPGRTYSACRKGYPDLSKVGLSVVNLARQPASPRIEQCHRGKVIPPHQNFFRVRLNRLNPSEKNCLQRHRRTGPETGRHRLVAGGQSITTLDVQAKLSSKKKDAATGFRLRAEMV